MPKPKEINVKEIKRIIKFIEKVPNRLEMREWGIQKGGEQAFRVEHAFPSCGTQACFAGWTLLCNTPRKEWDNLFDSRGVMFQSDTVSKAAEILGLGEADAMSIFTGCALAGNTPKEQLRLLKTDINRLFEDNDIEDRV